MSTRRNDQNFDPRDNEPASGTSRRENGVSVIIPTYRIPESVDACLDSLVAQTISTSRFEVVVVVNGPQSGDLDHYRQYRRRQPALALRLISTPAAGASHARNLGAQAARMPWLTFVDDDDFVSKGYLEGLLSMAGPRRIPVTLMSDVDPDGAVLADDLRNAQIRELASTVVDPSRCHRALGFNAAKLVPTDWARAVRYNTALASGEDVCFFGDLYARYDFDFAVVPLEADSVYYRRLTAGSQSRRDLSEQFAVSERLDVVEHLAQAGRRAPIGKRVVIDSLLTSQVMFTNRYAREHPDQRRHIESMIRQREIDGFPWGSLNRGFAETLVVSVCFPPFSDPSAVTVAKRIRQVGEVVDVICNNMVRVREVDRTLEQVAAQHISIKHQLDAPAVFGDWKGVAGFVAQGWQRVDGTDEEWPFRRLYSRAMWPASHALGACIKLRRPTTSWTAEFSDPISRTVTGEVREGSIEPDALLDELLEGARTRCQVDLPAPRSVYELTEMLPYAIADRLWFTNASQRDYMLSYCRSAELAELARSKAEVVPHPVPDPDLYHLVEVPEPASAGRATIAYFGTFYANRSIADLVDALRGLPIRVRRHVRLDVFTSQPEPLLQTVADLNLFDVINIAEPVSYLRFLNLATKYDCLVVNDAMTIGTHPQNPYLPSKWSDYKGSGSPIWAIVEPGSTLSALDPEHISVLGDTAGATHVLETLVDQHLARPHHEAGAIVDAGLLHG